MKKTLSPRQQQLLNFIGIYQADNNKIPTLGEMAKHLGVSVPRIQQIISALTRKKAIMRENIYKILATEVGVHLEKVEEIKQSDEASGPLL